MTCPHDMSVKPPPPAPPAPVSHLLPYISVSFLPPSPIITRLTPSHSSHRLIFATSHPPYHQEGDSDGDEDGSGEEGDSDEDGGSSDRADGDMEVRSCHPTLCCAACMHGSCILIRTPQPRTLQ